MPWKSYTKIDTAEARAEDGSKRIIEGTFRSKAVEWLRDLKWEAYEKADGTNASVHWNGYDLSFHDRADRAQLPEEVLEMLRAKFDDGRTEQVFEQLFPVRRFIGVDGSQIASDVVTEATIYGEAIGPKIQKVGKLYGPETRFLVFDIKVNGTYLDHDSDFYRRIVEALCLEEVPRLADMTIDEAKSFVKSKPRSHICVNAPMEGVVLQPKARLYEADGRRVIVKIKVKDYEPYNEAAEKYGWIKRGKSVVWDREDMDGRTMAVIPRRCTIKDILPTGGDPSPDYKVQSEDDRIVLRDIDNPGVEYVAKPGELRRYDKQQWLDYVMGAKNAKEEEV